MVEEVRTIETKTQGSSVSAIAFILGGLVVAVAIIGWFVTGGTLMPSSAGPGDKTSITIETPAAPTAPAADAPAAPAPKNP